MSPIEFVDVAAVGGRTPPGAAEATSSTRIIAVRVPTELAATVRTVLTTLAVALDADTVEALTEQWTPRRPVGRGVFQQAQRRAVARDELAAEFGLYSSTEVASLAESQEENAAAIAARWRDTGRIFAVPVAGSTRFPGFQIADGRPIPVVARVLDVVGERMSSWSLALWFTGPNSWLGGVRPVDVLTTGPDEVVVAAGKLADRLS